MDNKAFKLFSKMERKQRKHGHQQLKRTGGLLNEESHGVSKTNGKRQVFIELEVMSLLVLLSVGIVSQTTDAKSRY